jgi:hypothetical protein
MIITTTIAGTIQTLLYYHLHFSNLGSGTNVINETNYIARLMEYDVYNLELNYTKLEGNSEDQVSICIKFTR